MKLLDTCGTQAGVTVERTGYDTSDLTNKALLAAQQGNAPDVLVVDNPVVSTLAEAGVLTTTAENKLDTSAISPNLIAAGQSGGNTYGVPIGANTLALYYNKAVLDEAGVDIASVKDWASLTAALEKVKAAGKKGITFSAIGTEEGSFQFLPWFWGSGAQLTQLDSPQGVSAVTLWTDWLEEGPAPPTPSSTTPRPPAGRSSPSGDYAFAENGTWQLANAKEAGFEYGIIPVPAKDGGTAAAPTGGEFVSIPVQQDTARYATSQKLVTCLTSTDNSFATVSALSYIAPDRRGADPAEHREPRTRRLGRGGQGRQGPHRRRPRHQVPEDLRADVGRGPGGAERGQDPAAGDDRRADRGGERHPVGRRP